MPDSVRVRFYFELSHAKYCVGYNAEDNSGKWQRDPGLEDT